MHQTTTSKQNKTRFPCHTERPEMAPEHRPINIRKHDRLHGYKLDCYHTHQTLSSQQFSNLTGFPNFLLLQGMEKSDFLWAPVWGPKTTAKTGLATEGLPSSRACADIHACRAWRTIARGAAKSWKPSGMQNLSRTRRNNRNSKLALFFFWTLKRGSFCRQNCCHRAKKSTSFDSFFMCATKRPPFWGPFLDPKTGAKSPGHKQIKLRLNEWTPFWGPFLDPKTGVVLSAKLLSPSEKKHKFR